MAIAAGSMHLSGVHPSVRMSRHGPQRQTLLLDEISIDCCTAHRRVAGVCKQCNNTRPFNGPFSGTTRVSRYQKGKTNLDFTEARDSEWQWHQQVCISLETDNHASTPPLSVKALKA